VQVRLTAGGVSSTFTVTCTSAIGTVTKVGGDNQTVALNQAFQAVQVKVMNNGNPAQPLAGIPVAFNVTGGVATPTSTVADTGSDGVASAYFTAGSTPGVVTIAATAGTQTLTFTLTIRRPGPELTAASFMNAASFQTGVAFGGVIAIKGPGITTGMLVEPGACLSGVPDGIFERGLPTTLGRLQVQFGDRLAPIFAICKGLDGVDQVNVQAPMELAPMNDAFVVVKTDVGTDAQVDTVVSGVKILAAQPGVFEYAVNNVKYAIAFRPDGSVVSPSNPAQHGETISLYVTGLGPVLPMIATNRTGSLQHVPFFPIKVHVNGVEVPGASANYAVGKIGMFSVNFTVPDDAPAGASVSLTVWVTADGVPMASQNTRIAIQ
jgi:uncharacterized protein (TIGR03437 family)